MSTVANVSTRIRLTLRLLSFDVEYPIECDDEYWISADPQLAFKQPEGKPSKIAFANCIIRLQRILAYASRTLVRRQLAVSVYERVINGPSLAVLYQQVQADAWLCRPRMGTADRCRARFGPQQVDRHRTRTSCVYQSRPAPCLLTIPIVRWDPNRQDKVFMNQSSTLYAHYYIMQIYIHRPFIQPRKSSRLPFPSLTICTNAARSATHVMETQFQKTKTPLTLNRVGAMASQVYT